MDPLTWDYPELTNYQYASNDPILNIDLDGLEGFNAAFTGVGTAANELAPVVVKSTAKAASQKIGNEIINQALKKGTKNVIKSFTKKLVTRVLSKTVGLTISLVLTPSDAIKGKPKGDAPPGYHWGGDQWVKDRPINWPQTNPNPSDDPSRNPSKPDNDDDDNEYIYRAGPASEANLTPRPIIPEKTNDVEGPKRGLSTFTTPAEAMLRSGANKAQKISVKALRAQGLTVDYIGTHASIRPATQAELEAWANTRPRLATGGVPHVNTLKVKASIIGEVKK